MKLKILIFTFFTNFGPLGKIHDHLYKWCLKSFPQDLIECKSLLDEESFLENEKKHILDIFNPVILNKDSVKYIFNKSDLSFHDLHIKTNLNKLTPEESKRLKEVYTSIFGEWKPDIILCQGFINSKNIWGDIFPKALCIIQENAVFSRHPFKRTISYDSIGMVPVNFMITYKEDIKNFKITPEQNLKVEKFKKDFRKIFNTNSLVDKEMKIYKRRFKKNVLIPLVGTNGNMLFKDSIFEKDRDIVRYVMENIPKDVGVVVTRHPYSNDFNDNDIEYFRNKYENFIFIQKTNNIGDVPISLNYYKHVDAVLNVTSKVGIEAGLIYDKPIISLARQYNNLIKDGDDVRDVKNIIKKRKKINKNNILYWYLTHYITYEQSFDEKLYSIITKMLEKYRKNGIDFNFYEQNYTMDEAYDYVIKPVKEWYNYHTCLESLKIRISNTVQKIKEKIKTKFDKIKIKIKNCTKGCKKIVGYCRIVK